MTDRAAATNAAAETAEDIVRKGGRWASDAADSVRSDLDEARGASLDAFNKAMDWLDVQAERAPENLQPRARQAIDAARQRPLLTTLGALGVGLLAVSALTRRRR